MQILRTTIALIVAFLLSSLSALAFTVDGITYTASGTDATITGVSDSKITTLTIPATVTYNNKTYNVKVIGKNAFHKCTLLTELIIEDCETALEGVWYTNSSGWQTRSLPFEKCPLKTIYIGRDTSIVTGSAISGGLSLKNSGESVIVTVGGKCVQINTDTLDGIDLAEITLQGSLKEVRTKTFSGQTNLRKVVIGEGEGEISFADGNAFPDCPLETVELYRPLLGTSSNRRGFYNNTTVRHVVFGTPVIYKNMFYCENVVSYRVLPVVESIEFGNMAGRKGTTKTVIFEDAEMPVAVDNLPVDLLDYLYVGRQVPARFDQKYKAKKIEIGPYVTEVPNLLCSGHSELEEIILHENVNSIGQRAFFGCENLVTVAIPDNVSSIGEEAFMDCKKLEHINIPTSLSTIPKAMLKGCSSLNEDIIIKNYIKTIEEGAFDGCKLPKFIVEDGDDPIKFGSTSAFTSGSVDYMYFGRQPEKVRSGYYLLGGNIGTLELGSNVTEIISNFGIGSANVRNLIMSENIHKLTHSMFASCMSLETIKCNSGEPAVIEGKDNPDLKSEKFATVVVTVPTGTKRFYQEAEFWGRFQHIRSDEYLMLLSCDHECGTVSVNGLESEEETDSKEESESEAGNEPGKGTETEVESVIEEYHGNENETEDPGDDVDNNVKEIFIKEGAPLKIRIVPSEGFFLKNIVVDGEPVEHIDGVYEIENVDNDHNIDVVFDRVNTGVENVAYNFGIKVDNGFLSVTGYNGTCRVYDTNGIMVAVLENGNGIFLPRGIYVVDVDRKEFKVYVKK